MGYRGWLIGLLMLAGVGALLWQVALRPPVTVTLHVNGQPTPVTSRQRTIGALLREQGYTLAPQDIVYPPLAAPLDPARPISLFLARDVALEVDGAYRRLLTHAERVSDLLLEQNVPVAPGDALRLDGRPVALDAPLPHRTTAGDRPRLALAVIRPVPIEVDDDGVSLAFESHARTLGEALLEQGVLLAEGDLVSPALDAPVTAGMVVRIQRGTPAIVQADGRTARVRTRATTVGALLDQQGLALRELDRLTPLPSAPLTEDMHVVLTRIDHEWLYEREPIPFQQRTELRADMELDTQGLVQAGREGLFTRETLVIYENGVETERRPQRAYVELPPQDEIYGYGTKIVLRTVQTPDGPRQYWRRIHMLATSYTAATSGKSRNHPAYGITRTGVRAGYGVVAVDPRLIDLRSYVYVPGYGVGYAGDTGGAIKGRRIDLGYDESNLRLWYHTVDVYLLAPAPSPDQIRYVLP